MSLGQSPESERATAPADDRASESEHGAEPANQSVGQSPSAMAATTQRLDSLPGLPLIEHPDVYQRIHRELQSALAAIDSA